MKSDALIVLEMPVADGVHISQPERLALRFAGFSHLAHIWTFAYLTRNKSGRGYKVDEASLCSDRLPVIRNLTKLLSDRIEKVGNTPTSAAAYFTHIKKLFDWADGLGKGVNLWIDREETEALLLEYFGSLRVELAAGRLSSNTVAGLQGGLLTLARDFYDDAICRGFRPVKQGQSENATKPPEERDLTEFYGWVTEVFDKGADALLAGTPFPIGLDNPRNRSQKLWLVPNGKSRATLLNVDGGAAWDIENGCLRTIEAVTAIYAGNKRPRNVAMRALKQAQRILDEANSQQQHPERLSLASFACLAFGALFALETGGNEAVLKSLDYTDGLLEEIRAGKVTHSKFKALKLRADGKEVTLVISVGFVSRLQKYLKLRQALVAEADVDKLLIFLGERNVPKAYPHGWLTKNLRKRLGRLGVTVPPLGTRKLRAAKQDHLVRHEGPVVAAAIMQHGLATALRNYSNGSESVHQSEMGAYLGGLQDRVLEGQQTPPGTAESGVGVCTSPNQPRELVPGSPVAPSCRSTEGCLFCDKFKVHADEKDVRKLLSCKYCLKLAMDRFPSGGSDAVIADGIISRLDSLLAEIRTRVPAVVLRLEQEVNVEERLDPFWEVKLEQLTMLGVM